MAWASGIPGVMQVTATGTSSPRRLAAYSPTAMPRARPPGMPRPPFQMAKMRNGSSENESHEVAT